MKTFGPYYSLFILLHHIFNLRFIVFTNGSLYPDDGYVIRDLLLGNTVSSTKLQASGKLTVSIKPKQEVTKIFFQNIKVLTNETGSTTVIENNKDHYELELVLGNFKYTFKQNIHCSEVKLGEVLVWKYEEAVSNKYPKLLFFDNDDEKVSLEFDDSLCVYSKVSNAWTPKTFKPLELDITSKTGTNEYDYTENDKGTFVTKDEKIFSTIKLGNNKIWDPKGLYECVKKVVINEIGNADIKNVDIYFLNGNIKRFAKVEGSAAWSETLTPLSLDINKKLNGYYFFYSISDDFETYSAKNSYGFKNVRLGLQQIWESTNDVFAVKVELVDSSDLTKLKIFLSNGENKYFKREKDPSAQLNQPGDGTDSEKFASESGSSESAESSTSTQDADSSTSGTTPGTQTSSQTSGSTSVDQSSTHSSGSPKGAQSSESQNGSQSTPGAQSSTEAKSSTENQPSTETTHSSSDDQSSHQSQSSGQAPPIPPMPGMSSSTSSSTQSESTTPVTSGTDSSQSGSSSDQDGTSKSTESENSETGANSSDGSGSDNDASGKTAFAKESENSSSAQSSTDTSRQESSENGEKRSWVAKPFVECTESDYKNLTNGTASGSSDQSSVVSQDGSSGSFSLTESTKTTTPETSQ